MSFVVPSFRLEFSEQEPDNSVDEFATKVVKNNETVGHQLPREYS